MQIIRPRIFSQFPGIISGVSTRLCGNDEPPFYFNLSYRVGDKKEKVRENRKIFFGGLGIEEDAVSFQRQTHSVNSNLVSGPKFFEDSDALYTNLKNNFLAVSIADCIPVLLYEPDKKIIAAIHSGWKGTLNKITTVTIEKLKKEFSIDAGKIYAYIGPGISVKNFEVRKDVADLFTDDVKNFRSGRYFIDLKKHNCMQLQELGVKRDKIEISDYCTFEEKELFHSYRRDRDKSGRMLAVIGITD
jgi:polyphenol oxidase